MEIQDPTTARDLARAVGLDLDEIGLVTIDGVQSGLEDPVRPDSRICFFPLCFRRIVCPSTLPLLHLSESLSESASRSVFHFDHRYPRTDTDTIPDTDTDTEESCL